jgi:lysophospholipase L1-like esterase
MKQLKKILLLQLLLLLIAKGQAQNFFAANHPYISYTGRIDFSNKALPRFWQPGVYIEIEFFGTAAAVIVNDEVLWGKNHNYLQVVVDGQARRLKTRATTDTIQVAKGLANTKHHLLICKNTEANIGYLELVGIICQQLLPPPAKPTRKIECIGNSITCGSGSDQSAVPCGKGVWQDQHNAWLSYGAITARSLHAQFHLSSVSGIGLMHSCCNMEVVMPQVYDKISMRDNKISWNFKQYQPDVITVCLGQNDGIQDSAIFCNNYTRFIKTLRGYYPNATIVLLSSPMANTALRNFMRSSLAAVVKAVNKAVNKKDTRLHYYIFEQSYNEGCDGHPSLQQHEQIAQLLSGHIKKLMKW